MLEKLSDAKNTFEGKALAVFMAVVMAFSLSNLSSFASASEEDPSSDAPATQTADATNGAADNGTAESTQTGEPAPTAPTAPVETPSAPEAPAQNNAPVQNEAPAPSTDLPTAEPGVAVVGLDFAHAYIKYLGQELTAPLASFSAPLNKELAFTAHADTGFEVDKVKAVVGGVETELAPNEQTGEYKVPADLVTSNLTVKVEAKAVETESATPEDPTATPITSGTEIEAGEGEEADGSETEEPAVEEEAVEADPALTSPAYQGWAQVGDIVVKVTADENVLPEGTTVQAVEIVNQQVVDAVADAVEAQGRQLENAVAIDVTLIGPEGNVIQPSAAVNVSFFNTNLNPSEIGVYHVADDAASVEAVATLQADTDVQSFNVDHFSIYVVTEEGTPKLATYNFYDADGTLLNTQIVKNGDTLLEPEVQAAGDGEYFAGWYFKNGEEWGERFASFGAQTVAETQTYDVYGKYVKARYVYFMNDDASNPVVVATKQSADGMSVSTTDVTFPVGAEQSITGWYMTDPGNPVGDTVALDGEDITLYPIIENGHWLTFESNGGTYVNPAFYGAESSTIAPANPTRNGYRFDGWYSDERCTKTFNFGSALTSNATAYAKWTANANTKYTLVYWIENSDDSNYTFEKTATASGTTGANVSLTNTQTSTSNLNASYRSYFTYASSKTLGELSGTTIAGDGSTVVNVYYSRNTYTLTFKDGNKTVATISAKYNAKISDEFNKAPFNTTYNGRAWDDTGSYYKYALQTLDRMPGQNVTFKLYSKSSSTLKTIHYYVQKVDSSATPTSWPTGPGNDYELLKDVKTYFNYATYNEEYHEIEGFTRFSASAAGFSGNEKRFTNNQLSLYYIRNSYNLTFQNVNSIAKTESVKYEASLTGRYSYTPPRPDTMPENFEFGGWYTSPTCEDGTEASAVLTSMPAGNAIVYAKWAAPEVKATMYSDVNGTSVAKEMPLDYGATISQSDLPDIDVPADASFRGWYTKASDGTLVPFNFSTEIFSDIELYPYWTSNSSFSVTYAAGEATGTPPKDSMAYAQDSYAKILDSSGLTAPADKPVFLGWAASDGTVYRPGDQVKVTGNMVLTAQWGAVQDTVSLSYHANYPEGMSGSALNEIGGLANNAEHTLLGLADCGFNSSDDYVFLGWSTDASATEAEYAVGTAVRVDGLGANDLHGVWKKKTAITVEADSNSWNYDGAAHSQDSFKLTINGGQPISIGAEGTYTFENGDVLSADVEGSITNVVENDVANKITNLTITRNGEDVSGEYKITQSDGKLSIKPAEVVVTVTGHTDTKVYDGTAHTVSGYDVSIPEGSLYTEADFTFGGDATATRTEVGTTDMGLAADQFVNNNKNFTNVVFNVTDGWMKVDPTDAEVVVTVTGHTDTKVYDGTAHTVSGYDVSIPEGSLYTEADFTFGGDATATRTEVGTTDMGLAADQFVNNNKNFTNVVFNVTDGWMKVDPVALTIKADDNGKVYGQDDPELTANVTGLKGADEFTGTYEVTREAGETTGTYEITVNNVAFDNPNYTVETKPGTFVITPLGEAAIVVGDLTKIYDGTPLEPNVVTPVGLATGDYVDGIVYEGAQTNVGSSSATVTDYVIRNAEGVDVTESYTSIQVVPGTLTVSPATITVTANNQTKVAGTDDPELTYTFAGAVNGETARFAGGLQRVAGEDVGSYAINQGGLALVDNGDFRTSNYTLVFVPGTLTVTAATVPVTPPPTTPEPPLGTEPGDDPGIPFLDPIVQALEDAVTPLAGLQEETIADDDNPLAGYDRVNCWVHYYLILGIIVTVIYGGGVLVRRINFTRKLKGYEDDVLGVEDESAAVPAGAPMAMEGKEV